MIECRRCGQAMWIVDLDLARDLAAALEPPANATVAAWCDDCNLMAFVDERMPA